MSESIDVRVARLEEKMSFLVKDAEEAKTARKAQYKTTEDINRVINAMATEVSNVSSKLAGQAPTIEEFITIKHKVVGAGKLGKWLWLIGGILITIASGAREYILAWIK